MLFEVANGIVMGTGQHAFACFCKVVVRAITHRDCGIEIKVYYFNNAALFVVFFSAEAKQRPRGILD